MLINEVFFFSVLSNKLLGKMVKAGQRSLAENLIWKLFFLLKQTLKISLLIFLWKLVIRLQNPLYIQTVRVGARKYVLAAPAGKLQLIGAAVRIFLVLVAYKKKFLWLQAAFSVLTSLVLVNYWGGSTGNVYRLKSRLDYLPHAVFEQQRVGVTTRHLQHYRWK
jgi:hypothetical protein